MSVVDSSAVVPASSPQGSVEPQTNGNSINPSPDTGETPKGAVTSLIKRTVENGQVPAPLQEDPPALVSTMMEAANNKEMSVGVDSSTSRETPMETDDKNSVASHSDRGDSPDLVIVTHPEDEEAPLISSHPEKTEEEMMSGEEIDPNVPLEESSDDDIPLHTSQPHRDHTPHLKYVASSPVNGSSSVLVVKSSQEPVRRRRSLSPGHRTKQVAKLKQFFTTLQGFGNKLGSEAAEQVQELITALVVSTLVCKVRFGVHNTRKCFALWGCHATLHAEMNLNPILVTALRPCRIN